MTGASSPTWSRRRTGRRAPAHTPEPPPEDGSAPPPGKGETLRPSSFLSARHRTVISIVSSVGTKRLLLLVSLLSRWAADMFWVQGVEKMGGTDVFG